MNLRIETAESFVKSPELRVRESVENGSLRVESSLKSAFHAYGAAQSNLERIFAPDAMCVTSGQQPGLFTGPLYTIYKALSAAALAVRLEKRTGRAVVPVFWVAGDDHDFAEANHCFVRSLSNEIVRLELRQRDPDAALTPMYREKIGPDIAPVLEQLETITPGTEFKPGIMKWIRSHYIPEADLSSAFAGAVAELLSRFGVVVFSPTEVQAKRAMSRWLLAALENAGALDRSLRDRAAELEAQGLAAPVTVGVGASTVMVESKSGRDRLLIDGDSFRTRRAQELWTVESLTDLLRESPERLSPNVLLRPVVEAAVLPTVAYIAGPGELAYLPQASPIYDALHVEPQIPVPRWSGMAIEGRTSKALAKYGIGIDDLCLPDGQLEALVLKDQLPKSVADALRTVQETVQRDYGRLAGAVADVDTALQKLVVAAEKGALRELNNVEKRVMRHVKTQNETTVRQLGNARASLFPMGKPQERVFNITHFLVRYGNDFIDAVFERCMEWADTLETGSGGA